VPEDYYKRLPMRRPLISLSLAFGCGILVQGISGLPSLIGWALAGTSALAAAGLAQLKRGGVLRFFLWLLAFLSLGFARGALPPIKSGPPVEDLAVIQAQARSAWDVYPDRRRIEVNLEAMGAQFQAPKPVAARTLLSVRDPAGAVDCPRLLPGDQFLAMARIHQPRSRHDPGLSDIAAGMHRRGIDWIGWLRSCRDILVTNKPVSLSARRWIANARSAFAGFVFERKADSASKGILTAMTTGQRGLVGEKVKQDFARAGLAHLLAISGLHLGFVAFGLYALMYLLLARIGWLVMRFDVRRISAAAVIPATLFYTLMSGAHLPAVRACVMVLCFLAAVIARRQSDPLQTLCAAALIIMGIWPQSLYQVSFQLSFTAVASVILAVPVLAEKLRLPLDRAGLDDSWRRRILVRTAHFALLTFVASLATAPLLAHYFNQLSLTGLLVNLVAVPLATWVIVPLGLVTALLFAVFPLLAGLVADAALMAAGWLAGLASHVAEFSWSAIHVSTPSFVQIGLIYILLFCVLKWRRLWARRLAVASLFSLLAIFVAGWLGPLLSSDLEVTFLDVGQGDSAFLRFPGGDTLLVDGGDAREGGADSGLRVVAPFLWYRGITRLDVVAVTHPEMDHAGGLASVVRLFAPHEIWTARPLDEMPATRPLLAAAREVGANVRRLHAGDRPQLGKNTAIEVLWPDAESEALETNERSLVLRVSLDQRSFLLTGDLEKEGERLLIESGKELGADVLKVGHHGSRQATSKELLDRVKPSLAVISVGGQNAHHLPSSETIERLREAGVKILRTDSDGAVTISTDGLDLEFDTFLP
jgi:competence protein ComEC